MASPIGIVGKIVLIKSVGPLGDQVKLKPPRAPSGQFYRFIGSFSCPEHPNWDVINAVVVRHIGQETHAAIAMEEMDLWLGDTIRTGPDCVLVIEFTIGGRVGINRASAVTINSERSVIDDEVSFKRLIMNKAGVWGRTAKYKDPLEIQWKGGVMGGLKG